MGNPPEKDPLAVCTGHDLDAEASGTVFFQCGNGCPDTYRRGKGSDVWRPCNCIIVPVYAGEAKFLPDGTIVRNGDSRVERDAFNLFNMRARRAFKTHNDSIWAKDQHARLQPALCRLTDSGASDSAAQVQR